MPDAPVGISRMARSASRAQVDPFSEELVRTIEVHEFEPVRVLQWRTTQLDFSTLPGLIGSIDTIAPIEGLTRALPAVDVETLHLLSRDEEVGRLATSSERVAMLWEACALPDYRKIAPAQHAELVVAIYKDLAKRGYVDENYMAEQVQARGPDGRRNRHAFAAHCPDSYLDICGKSSWMACQSVTLAAKDASNRGPLVGRLA